MAILELDRIEKRFPGVTALGGVSLSVDRGQVVALIGENGAGKSTLMKILGGVHRPDGGQIRVDGVPVSIDSVASSERLGIGFVHQELNNLDNLDVAGNVFLGREPTRGGVLKWIDRRSICRQCKLLLDRLKLDVDPRTPLGKLSLAKQQLVEIAKALSQNARVLILDEPTSSLTQAETDRLLACVDQLRSDGVGVIYISHRLAEVRQIADRVVVLRDGVNVGELASGQIDHDAMVRMMVGREVKDFYTPPRSIPQAGRLAVRGVTTATFPAQPVSFEAAGGEILGIAGLVGAGRSELVQAIFGVDRMLAGVVTVDGVAVRYSGRSPKPAITSGIFLVPEDRKKDGLLTGMAVRENVTLPDLPRYARATLVDRRHETAVTLEQIRSLAIKTGSTETRVGLLSGGNQQKVALAKWLKMRPKVLIVDEPTRGIDVGARAEIYRLLRELTETGAAVVVVSSDLEEVLGICDRLLVMREGAVAGRLNRTDFTEQAVMDLAFGRVRAGASRRP